MQLKCIHCPYIAISLLLDHDLALNEISNSFFTHINKVHEKQATQLVKDHMHLAKVAMWLMTITKHSTYLDDMEKRSVEESMKDDPLEEAFDNQVEQMEELVGIEMFGNRPQEDGEDGDDKVDNLEDETSIDIDTPLLGPPPGALPQ